MVSFASAKSPRDSARSTSPPTTAEEKEYSVPRGIYVNVQEGERLRAGEALIDGPLNPHDILEVLGERELQSYLVNEIQEVYRLQGVAISDKHIETIVRQMLRWVKIEEVGDTSFLLEQQTDRFRFNDENERVIAEGWSSVPSVVRCCSASPRRRSRPIASSRPPPSRRQPASSPRRASTAPSTRFAASRRTSSSVVSSLPAPAWSTTATSSSHPSSKKRLPRCSRKSHAAYEEDERELELMRQEGEAEELAAE